MKLTLESLPAQLQQRLLPAYLVSGDDPLRLGEACDLIRARARAAGFSERAVFFIERAGSVWDEAQQAAQSLSLFAQRRTSRSACRPARPAPPAGRRCSDWWLRPGMICCCW